jgi:hypothetical protein
MKEERTAFAAISAAQDYPQRDSDLWFRFIDPDRPYGYNPGIMMYMQAAFLSSGPEEMLADTCSEKISAECPQPQQ